MRPARSLQDLDGGPWPAPPADSTRLVLTAHALRRKPLRDLTPEDLRLLINQGIGLPHLLPLALALLRTDPLTEGDLYPGDLLAAVLRCSPALRQTHPDLAAELRTIVTALTGLPPDLARAAAAFTAG
ncbi:contact-dependent growth inhibition system immunity protein [Kitasatospora sp. NPDC002227]|uniref:contact-dependent growth inhibition system immunity protein n=1 Tax=Kitasatospora sp. NPDC002227 TaxID=3154773 RepID=UPI00331F8BA8